MSTKTLMTVEEFAQMDTADTERYELVAGELVPLSGSTLFHNEIRDLLGHLLWIYFKSNPIGKAVGENECQLSADTVRCPDISIFLADRLRQIDRKKSPTPLAPDIAVEILSPSQTAMDVRRKVRDYLRAGTKEIWLLDHSNGELMIQTKTGILALQGAEVLESSLLPGFSVPVADLLFIE
jgi:Uma2 family endonuclease